MATGWLSRYARQPGYQVSRMVTRAWRSASTVVLIEPAVEGLYVISFSISVLVSRSPKRGLGVLAVTTILPLSRLVMAPIFNSAKASVSVLSNEAIACPVDWISSDAGQLTPGMWNRVLTRGTSKSFCCWRICESAREAGFVNQAPVSWPSGCMVKRRACPSSTLCGKADRVLGVDVMVLQAAVGLVVPATTSNSSKETASIVFLR